MFPDCQLQVRIFYDNSNFHLLIHLFIHRGTISGTPRNVQHSVTMKASGFPRQQKMCDDFEATSLS